MKKSYIVELEDHLQKKIKKELLLFYQTDLVLSEIETTIELEKAMNSRLGDLSDTINIYKIINYRQE